MAGGAIIPVAMKIMYFALLALLFSVAVAGQNPPQPPASENLSDTPITLDVTRVNLLFTVTDKKGRFVSNLTKDDFEITEDKKKQQILDFTAESDLPLRLAILLDTSNSIRDRFRFLQEAAIDFINTTMRAQQDKAIVMSFDTEAQLAVDLTDDKLALTQAISRMRPGGGTALYEAIFLAARDKLMKDQPRDKYRRALIVLSDGEDTLSRYTREQALEMAQKADTVIYCISTNQTHLSTDGDKVLRHFAVETGGIAFFPFKAEDMDQSFVNIANELRHQYNVLYRPEPLIADGKYHEIDIRVKTVGDMIVRARQGYYAPPPVR
jgi:Ca-activated chloride channel family protein